jgi:hypothetical protein
MKLTRLADQQLHQLLRLRQWQANLRRLLQPRTRELGRPSLGGCHGWSHHRCRYESHLGRQDGDAATATAATTNTWHQPLPPSSFLNRDRLLLSPSATSPYSTKGPNIDLFPLFPFHHLSSSSPQPPPHILLHHHRHLPRRRDPRVLQGPVSESVGRDGGNDSVDVV